VLGTLHGLIWSHLQIHPTGKVFLAPFDVVLSMFDVVEPDLLYLSNDRAAKALTPDNVKGAPELVVEIASKGTRRRDETIKRRLYERAGVSEYWLVDPATDVIRVYRSEGTRFGRPIELSREAGDVLTTSLLPGLRWRSPDLQDSGRGLRDRDRPPEKSAETFRRRPRPKPGHLLHAPVAASSLTHARSRCGSRSR
jgi:Uma2 family endonuclease